MTIGFEQASLRPPEVVEAYRQRGYWQEETLGEGLRRWAEIHGDRVALTDHQGETSFGALDRRADRLAGGLYGLGIAPGDRVLVQLPNGVPFVALSFALFRLGAIPIFALPAQRLHDLDGLCQIAQPVAYVCEDRFLGFDYRAMAQELAARHACLRLILVEGEAGAHHDLGALDGELPDTITPRSIDIACLLLSGGTTGTPKLIPRSHADYAYNARASAELCGLSADTVYLAALPAAHNFTLACPGIIGTLSCGGRVVMARTPSGDETFPLIALQKVTVTSLVPALVTLWLQQREWDDSDLSSLRLLQVGGARLSPEVARQVGPTLGCGLQQVFGMAEGLLCFTRRDDPDEVIVNTQGRPLCVDDEVRLVNPDGNDVQPGEVGELQVRGPYTIRGYYNAEVHNRTAFTPDGYYRSGDLVRRRPDGNLVVEGRVKEQINRAGEKIASAEIEEHLRAHPGVGDAVLLGVPDDTLGERTCAVLIVRGTRPTLAALHDFLRERGLPRFKLPDELRFAATWPLTPIGKIDRRRLAEATEPVAPASRKFLEEVVALSAEPLTVAALLTEHGLEESATVYERDGEWSVGLGSVAEIRADIQAVQLRGDVATAHWPASDLMAGVAASLAALPWKGWRAYGFAEFELARLLQDMPLEDPAQSLLQLTIPRLECRLRAGEATLRALDQDGLTRLRRALQQIEARCLLDDDMMAQRRREHGLDVRNVDRAGADLYKLETAAAIEEIAAGAYHKVILSRRVPLDRELDIAASYVVGRRANHPARSFLLWRPTFQAAGFSPETVVEVGADGWVGTQPLAGTRALVEDEAENAVLARELQTDLKEVAEHAVSVKLAFEELAACCEPDTVGIPEFMAVRRRGSVQHLASRVVGKLRGDRDRWSAFRALFPAVTASGIPKREAITAIGRHEGGPRGLYSGCVLVADQDGFLDAALVLRAIYQRDGQSWLRAGAGIVGLSTPERELEETCEKLRSVAQNLVASAQSAPASRQLRSVVEA